MTEAVNYGYVTYTAPSFSLSAPTITLCEGRSLLASGGDTRLRTWEVALLLGTYLYTEGRELVHRKTILELGAGTEFLSILCAKHLRSFHVVATDGSPKCVNDIDANICLNGLEGDLQGIISAVLQRGHLDEEDNAGAVSLKWPEFKTFLRKNLGDSRAFIDSSWSRVKRNSQYLLEDVQD